MKLKKLMKLRFDFKSKKGISLLLTIIVLSLVLSISIGIFNIIYNELLLSGDIKSSFFALYAADEIVERTAYLDRNLKTICVSPAANCYSVTSPVPPASPNASNGACGSVSVSKNPVLNSTSITGIGQFPCDPQSNLLTKRSFFYQYPMVELEDLAGWWRFEDGVGQATPDSSSNKNHAVLGESMSSETEDPKWQSGPGNSVSVGGALEFNYPVYENDRARVEDSASLELDFPVTFEAWVCAKDTSGLRTIFKKGEAGAENYGFALSGGRIYFEFKDLGGTVRSATAPAGTGVTVYQWTHVAAAYDGVNINFYKNGSFVSASTQNAQMDLSVTSPLRLGFDFDNPANGFIGILDEVKIFNQAHDLNQIQRDYNSIQPSIPGC